MTHEEYLVKVQEQQSLIRRLLKSRKNRSLMIERLAQERYKNIIGQFFKIGQDMEHDFPGVYPGYFYIHGIDTESNFCASDKIVVNLRCRQYGEQGCFYGDYRATNSVYYIDHTFCYNPTKDICKLLDPLIVSKDEVIADLRKKCEKMINDLQYIEQQHQTLF